MKTLLISMPDITPSSADWMLLPSLGIASLAGNVNPNNHTIAIQDLVLVRKNVFPFLRETIDELQPQVIGLSGFTCSVYTALKIAEFIKINYPKIIVIFGGYMALCHYEELIQADRAKWIDFIVRGEAEVTFSELLNELDSDNNYQKINGLTYKQDGKFISNPERELSLLEKIKIPSRRSRIISNGLHVYGIKTDMVETSRGCTFDCTFCCVTEQYGRKLRNYSIDRVLTDIEDAYSNGARMIVLADDNITLDVKRLGKLCDEIIAAKLKGLKFFAQAAVKPIADNPELVKLMRTSGFEVMFLGLENLIQRNLDFLHKKTSGYELADKAFKNIRHNKIISSAGIIFGNPEDREEDLWENYRLVKKMKVDLPNFLILTPFPKTRIREELKTEGLLTNPTGYERYDLIQANIKTKFISSERLETLTREIYVKYYLSFYNFMHNLFLRKYVWYTTKYALGEMFHLLKHKLKTRKKY